MTFILIKWWISAICLRLVHGCMKPSKNTLQITKDNLDCLIKEVLYLYRVKLIFHVSGFHWYEICVNDLKYVPMI